MPIWVDSHANNRIIRITINDPWQVDDLLSLGVSAELRENPPTHSIHWLIDVRGAKLMPPDLVRLRESSAFGLPHTGWFVVLGARPVGASLMRLVFSLIDFKKGRFFESEEDAWAYLHKALIDEDRAETR